MRKVYQKNKFVFGVGVNDADYVVKPISPGGKRERCPFYTAWKNMLGRAYDTKHHAFFPTYIGVTVCEEWHSFMAFRAWMMGQDWEGKHLDKDIRQPGNKHYCPQTCMFVTQQINNLLLDCAATRGDLPIGVGRCYGRYKARVSENNKSKHLGLFDTPEEAHLAWRKAKVAIIRRAAMTGDIYLYAGLMPRAKLIEQGEAA
tara:strand:- start:2789 stop:3391 length:603 start_codon:yes stop_codon:yes gene_type:complete